MFDFPVINGNSKSALINKFSIVVSRESAVKYFGNDNPLGKSLKISLNDSIMTFEVTAVVDNMRNESSIRFDLLIPFDHFELVVLRRLLTSYGIASIEAFVLVENPDVEQGLSPVLSAVLQKDGDKKIETEVGLQPLDTIHFDDRIIGNAIYINPMKLYIISALAFLVLVVAIINFITLTTGQSMRRMKEVGLRKTLGVVRRQIIAQLIIESFLISMISAFIGVGIAFFLAPFIESLFGSTFLFELDLLSAAFLIILSLMIAIITGLVQAIALVKFKPVDALKGNIPTIRKDSLSSQTMMVFQFTLSVLLLLAHW